MTTPSAPPLATLPALQNLPVLQRQMPLVSAQHLLLGLASGTLVSCRSSLDTSRRCAGSSGHSTARFSTCLNPYSRYIITNIASNIVSVCLERMLASGGNDNKLYVWSPVTLGARSTAEPLCRFNDHTAAVKAVAWYVLLLSYVFISLPAYISITSDRTYAQVSAYPRATGFRWWYRR